MKSDFLKEMQARGFIHQSSNLDALDDILSDGKIIGYWGTDPTMDSLHIGHLASLMLARWFQKFGHKPIMLVGGATGRIGDPSGRDNGRPMLSDKDIEKNCAGLRKSISKIVKFGDTDNDAIMVDNYDWMKGYSHLDFLAEFGTAFTVPHMLSMESVRRRMETGMTFLEFNYMTFQAVDFLELYKKYNCVLQFCGADQWGNAIMGIDLVRKKLGKEVFVLSTPLITDANGNKIGKSAGNAVWVNEDKTTPFEYYQYFRNTPDELVEKFLLIFTEIPLDEVARIAALQGAEINEAKKILAYHATKIAHGEDAAKDAADAAAALFACGSGGTDSVPTKNFPADKLAGINIVDFIVAVGLVPSKAEARRTIEQGGLSMNGARVVDIAMPPVVETGEVMLQKGKKTFLKVMIK